MYLQFRTAIHLRRPWLITHDYLSRCVAHELRVCYSAREGWDGPVVIYFRNLFLGSLATTTVKLNNLR